jgi:SAM-dependent methyltransferase
MRPSDLIFHLRQSIAEIGVRRTLVRTGVHLYRRVVPIKTPVHPFDLRHRVDTSSLIGKTQLTSGHPHDRFITGYWGTSPSLLREVLARWQQTLVETPNICHDFSFIDIGCGKGRVVMLASELPFRQIIGVELSPSLAAIAQKNLGIWNKSAHACNDLTILNVDALAVPIPDSPVLLYLYNPFDAPVMQLLLDRLQALALTRSHPIDLIFVRPEHTQLFDLIPNMHLLFEGEAQFTPEDTAADAFQTRAQDYRIYRLTGPRKP